MSAAVRRACANIAMGVMTRRSATRTIRISGAICASFWFSWSSDDCRLAFEPVSRALRFIDNERSDALAVKRRIAKQGLRRLGASVIEVQVVLPGEADAAVHLNAAVSDLAKGVRAI